MRAARDIRASVPTSIERLVAHAAREVQMLAALTPLQAYRERQRLVGAIQSGKPALPRWTYAPVAHADLRSALAAAERVLARGGEPLQLLYLGRVRELSLEAALCAAAGTHDVAELARERFAAGDPDIVRGALELCDAWLVEPSVPTAGSHLVSDDPHPRSLLSQMRQAVSKLRLPFEVVARRSLAPLAATGERVILVAAGRLVHEEDAVRTVLHEVEGHARPRARSQDSPMALMQIGTARGVDDQEGRALLLEERAGMLGHRRRRQLAARHRAVQAMLAGASFADVASMLIEAPGLDPVDAVVVAERAFRGSDGTRPGLGRERLYLESFVRVRAHLGARPEDEAWMSAGQVASDAVKTLRQCSRRLH
ncbi:MAG: flavohemoglobin expression-modulating QEGLA motif protein [Myxococcota bacterium]|nr:flavohemoglobin expression-modulating QEGLA motif protein [Myxococcota bacterium]